MFLNNQAVQRLRKREPSGCLSRQKPDILENGDDFMEYTIEMCPNCMTEQVIYSKGITPCSNCGHPLAPCSVCESCNYDTCPYGCDGTENDSYKRATNPVIPEDLQKKLYREL